MAPSSLQGRACLVTGATGGLGRAIAQTFAEAGCRVYLTGRDVSRLAETARAIVAAAGRAAVLGCEVADLRSPAAIDRLAAQATAAAPIDVLVNNAGVFLSKPLREITPAEFDECLEVNVRAPFLLARALVPAMCKRGWGRVVNIGSSSAYAGFKGGTTYCASKHGLLGLSRALHAEIVAEGVRSYCISPGSIKTPMGRQVPDENYETFMTPEEVARYVAIVVSFDGEMAIEESRLSRVGERRRPPPS